MPLTKIGSTVGQHVVVPLISIFLAVGFFAAAFLGSFEPGWVGAFGYVLSALCLTFAIGLFSPIAVSPLLIRGYLATVMVAVLILTMTIQPAPRGTLSGFVFLGFAVAIAAYDVMTPALVLSSIAVAFGTASLILRSTQPWIASGVFISVAVIALVAVFGFRRAATSVTAAAVADSLRDPLTGLTNRRGMPVGIALLGAIADRSKQRLGCLIVDLDNFKRVNDELGHDVGDRVLRSVADAIRDTSRQGDLLVRLGGEEFALFTVVPGSTELARIGERLRASVEALKKDTTVTASVGGALNASATPLVVEELIRRADKQLYAAKASGRNTVRVARA